MLAQLGSLVFATVGPLTGLESRQEFGFAEHAVIEGKPRLQYVGDELETITLEMTFASAFCDVPGSVAALRVMGRAHEAVPLLWGTGEVRGQYVIRELEETTRATSATGVLERVTCRVRLMEYFDPSPAGAAERRRREEAEAANADLSAIATRMPPPRVVALPKEEVPVPAITRWGN